MHLRSRSLITLALILALSAGTWPVLASPTPSFDGIPGGIEGRVFATDMETPLAGFFVRAFAIGAVEPTASTTTDVEGTFRIGGLPAGDYLLMLADPAGQPLAAARATARGGLDQRVLLALPSPEEAVLAPDASRFAEWLQTPLGATIGILVAAVSLAWLADELSDDETELADVDFDPSRVEP